ncbi:MAG: tetratricopeptide repeat protein [Planctomycetaceae bacterium]|nr:tetratricopeptide repeat protein [Planctomycetaceae bacterium]
MRRLTSLFLISFVVAGCGKTDSPEVAQTAKGAPGSPSPASSSPMPPVEDLDRSKEAYEQVMAAADQFLANQDANNAVRALSQAIQLKPMDPNAYVKRAAILAEAKMLAQAVSDMTAAIELQPENPKLLNTRGYFRLLMQDFSQADQDFSDAIGLSLDYPQPYNNRGLVNVSLGKFEEAILDFDNALKVQSDYVDALNNKGFALINLERYDEAVSCLSEALKINPDYMNAITNRARAYSATQEHALSAEDYSKAIKLSPGTLQYHLLRAAEYRAAGNEEAALADTEYVNWAKKLVAIDLRIRQNPRNAEAWTAKGRHFLIRSDLDKANECFASAMKVNPRFADAFLGRALSHYKAGNWEQAVTDCDQALALEQLPEAFSIRADACFELGRMDDAIAGYESAKRFDSQVVEAYRKRSSQRKQAGDVELAKQDEDKANSLEKYLSGEFTPQEEAKAPALVVPVNFEQEAKVDEESVNR